MTQAQTNEEADNERMMSPVKTGLIVSGIVLLAAALGLTVVYLLGNDSETSVFETNALSDSERSDIETTVQNFMAEAGTFGVNEDEYSAGDFHTIYQRWRNEQSVEGMYDEFFTTRDEAYLELREEHIVPDSPLWYDAENVEEWDILDDVYQHRSFSLNPETVSFPYIEQIHDPEEEDSDTGIDSGYRLAEVTVEWTSAERVREEISRRGQSDWNGSVRVLEREYVDTTATVVLAEVNGEWMIYNHDVNSNPHLLSTWDNIRENPIDKEFTEVSTMTPTPEFRTLTETSDGNYEDADGNIVEESSVRPGEHIISESFYNYCSEDMPEHFGDPEDDGFREVRDGDDCTWVRDGPQDYHPDESALNAD